MQPDTLPSIIDQPALDYLVIAPHPDDAELGAGGTILLLKADRWEFSI